MNPATIIGALQLAEMLFGTATTAYAAIKNDLDATTQTQINQAIASSGAALDTARTQLDTDAGETPTPVIEK
jgi:hypothetical protein